MIRDPARASDPVFSRSLRLDSAERAEAAYAELERLAISQGDDVRTEDQDRADAQRRSVLRSVRRARQVVKDLARSNEWSYFVTLTLDPEKVNRYDPDEILKHLRHWLGNNVRRRGLRYVLVPEHHKDGAIHFHGLFNDALQAVDSGTISVPGRKAPVKARSEAHRKALEEQGGHVVYNLPGWGWGFSTAIQLYGEMDAAINYVCKYIGKEMGANSPENIVSRETSEHFGKIGGRWYYSGGDLQRPTVEWFDVDLRDWEGYDGWYSPAALPDVRFLTLRVTADGEILAPWTPPGKGDAKRDSDSNPREDGAQAAACDAVPEGRFWWPFRRDCDCRGSLPVLPEGAFAVLQLCGTEETFDTLLWTFLYTENRAPSKIEGQLTKSGLSAGGTRALKQSPTHTLPKSPSSLRAATDRAT